MLSNDIKFRWDMENIYILSVIIALGLLFYANADNIETPGIEKVSLGIGKLFYAPCLVALFSSFFIKKEKDRYNRLFKTLVLLALVSSLLHPPYQSSNPLAWTVTRFTFGILCFKDLKNVNPYIFARLATLASPIIITPHYILTNPFAYGTHRYGGFYGDPNFLAMALILLIVCCYITILKENKSLYSIIGYFSIVTAIPLIFVGMSRGGLIGLGMIMSIILLNIRKTNKKLFYLFILVFLFSLGSIIVEFSELFTSITSRFLNENDSDDYSTMARIYGIQSAIEVFVNYPAVIPFGIGMGNTVYTLNEYSQYGFFWKGEIHNTFISMMYEGGGIMAFVYLYIYYKIFKSLFIYKNYLLLAVLLSLFLSMNTLPGASFMPGWITLFLLCNNQLLNLNNTETT